MTIMWSQVIVSFVFFFTVFCDYVYSWDNDVTHKDLSRSAAENSILSNANGDYLKNIGVDKGLKESFKWNKKQTIVDWLREGAKLEDAGSNWDYLIGTARSFNHFHNPLKQWPGAGLNDTYTGKSALLWAQDQAYLFTP